MAEVVPDSFVRAPTPQGVTGGQGAGAKGHAGRRSAHAHAAAAGQQVCPSNPSKPIVAPEGLKLPSGVGATAPALAGPPPSLVFRH